MHFDQGPLPARSHFVGKLYHRANDSSTLSLQGNLFEETITKVPSELQLRDGRSKKCGRS
jgi:hypothetical protein